MTAPVMRDVDIVTQNRVASTLVETATATTGGRALTVLDSATTTGATLQAALDTAGDNSTVLLTGTFNTDANNGTTISLRSGQTLMGTGRLTVRSPSGRMATLTNTSSATLAGNYNSAAANKVSIEMADNSTLTGVTLNQTGSGTFGQFAIHASGKTGVVISNNTINVSHDQNTVIGIYLESGTSATVSGNSITASNSNGGGGTAYGIRLNRASATIATNTISATSASGTGYRAPVFRNNGTAPNPSAFLSGSTGNTFLTAGGCSDVNTVSGTLGYTDAGGVARTCP